jgi:hypothetical protein
MRSARAISQPVWSTLQAGASRSGDKVSK